MPIVQAIVLLLVSSLFLVCGARHVDGQVLTPSPLLPSTPTLQLGPDANFQTAVSLAMSPDLPDLNKLDLDQPSWIDGQVPGGYGRYEVWRHIPLEKLDLKDNSITVADTVWWFIDDGDFAQCGWDDEPAREVYFSVVTEVGLGADWKIHSNSTPAPPDVRNRCLLTHWDIDVTDRVIGKAEPFFQAAVTKMNSKIENEVDFSQMKSLWNLLAVPQQPGPGSYVNIPQAAAASPLSLTKTNVTTTFLIEKATVKVPGPTTAVLPPQLLVVGAFQTFHINGDLLMPNAAFEQLIAPKASSALQVPGVRRLLTVTSVKFYEVQEHVGFQLEFHVEAVRGRVTPVQDLVSLFRRTFEALRYRVDEKFDRLSGTLYVEGDPKLETSDHRLSLTSLVYSQPTIADGERMRRARWIFSSSLIPQLTDLAHLSTAPGESDTKTRLTRTVKLGSGAKLDIMPNKVSPVSANTVDGGIAVTVAVDGTLRVGVVTP